jgi:hypothetical protein
MDLRKNEDDSVDIYCGPTAPAGFEKNWIPTVPGRNWFAYFRFYQPTEAFHATDLRRRRTRPARSTSRLPGAGPRASFFP